MSKSGNNSGIAGLKFLGRYVPVDRIGKGAYGEVYRGYDTETNEEVAIKRIEIPNEYANDTSAVDHLDRSFLREVSAMASLSATQSSCVVKMLAFDATENIIVMKYYPTNLRAVKNPSSDLLRYITYQLIIGIHNNFVNGILHRDLKPDNILYDPSTGNVFIGDYGISRYLFASMSRLTGGMFTLWWSPPEVLSGATVYDFAGDIWSLGIILLELFTGPLVFAKKKVGLDLNVPSERQQEYMLMLIEDLLKTTGDIDPDEESLRAYLRNGKLTIEQYNLLNRILRYRPQERAMPYELIQDPYIRMYGSELPIQPVKPETLKQLNGSLNPGLGKYSASIYESMRFFDQQVPRFVLTEEQMKNRFAIFDKANRTYPAFFKGALAMGAVMSHAIYTFDTLFVTNTTMNPEDGAIVFFNVVKLSSWTLMSVEPINMSRIRKTFDRTQTSDLLNLFGGVYRTVPSRMLKYVIADQLPELKNIAKDGKVKRKYEEQLLQDMILGLHIMSHIDVLIYSILNIENPETSAAIQNNREYCKSLVSDYSLPWMS